MQINVMNKSWDLSNKLAFGLLVSNVVLAIGFVLLLFRYDQSVGKERIVISPPHAVGKISVGWSDADDAYFKSFGMYFAGLIGDANPGRADFVLKAVSYYVSPSILPDVRAAVIQNSSNPALKRPNTSVSYQQKSVFFERSTSKVFVVGSYYVHSTAFESKPDPFVMEIGLEIRDGKPLVVSLESYPGDKMATQELLASSPEAYDRIKRGGKAAPVEN